jgi:HSP20 family protein
VAQRIGKELEAMQQRLERLLDQAMDRHTTGLARANPKWHPPVDAYETEEEFVVLVALAGMSKESIQITYQEPDLRIWGTRSASPHSGKVKYHQMEINFGPFERIIRIGFPVQADRINAQYKDGFLTIYIPKNLKRKVIKVRKEE